MIFVDVLPLHTCVSLKRERFYRILMTMLDMVDVFLPCMVGPFASHHSMTCEPLKR